MEINGFLQGGEGYYLRTRAFPENFDGYLYANNSPGNDGYLRREGRPANAIVVLSFPTQYPGLRFFHGTVQSLCLVLPADAPAGDTPMVDKNGTVYALYLVDPADPNASSVMVMTAGGVKAVRLNA